MDDFCPPLGGDSREKAVHACNHAKDWDKVKLDIIGFSTVKTLGCIDLARILVQALG